MKINTLTPNLAVSDVRQTIQFYSENLGFELIMAVPETQDGIDEQLSDNKVYVYEFLKKDNVELMLQRVDCFHEDVTIDGKIGASVSFYMQGKGIEAFYEELKNKTIQVFELKLTWYGIKEFYIRDNNGYVLVPYLSNSCNFWQDIQ